MFAFSEPSAAFVYVTAGSKSWEITSAHSLPSVPRPRLVAQKGTRARSGLRRRRRKRRRRSPPSFPLLSLSSPPRPDCAIASGGAGGTARSPAPGRGREEKREGGREEGRRQLPPAPRLRGPRRRGCGSRRAPRGCNRPQPPPAAPEPMGCARRLLGGEYSSGNPPPGYPPLPDPPPRAPQRADPLRFLCPSISGRFSASFSLPFSPEPLMRALPPARIACRRGGLRGICRAVIKLFSPPPLARMK